MTARYRKARTYTEDRSTISVEARKVHKGRALHSIVLSIECRREDSPSKLTLTRSQDIESFLACLDGIREWWQEGNACSDPRD
ncbi:MAG: hypothetical protein GY906_12800 [bacterium]|nr:hypothetical protein [bacterium]